MTSQETFNAVMSGDFSELYSGEEAMSPEDIVALLEDHGYVEWVGDNETGYYMVVKQPFSFNNIKGYEPGEDFP